MNNMNTKYRNNLCRCYLFSGDRTNIYESYQVTNTYESSIQEIRGFIGNDSSTLPLREVRV